jgi:hypothetical protein
VERNSQIPFEPSTVRPKLPIRQPRTPLESFGLPPSAMAPYRFRHSGHVYDVRFTWAADCWSGTLHRDGDERGRQLITLVEGLARELSHVAVQDGFMSVAEWLVKTGQWCEPPEPNAVFCSPM